MNGLVQPASPVSAGSVAQLALSLAAIIALILAVSWVLKRLKLGTVRGRGEIAVIDQLSLGPRERIVLVRVGESQVLVGVSAGGLVGSPPRRAHRDQEPARCGGFADRLREFMKRPGRGR